MSLRLIRPGGRKNNRYWIVRGTVAGRRIEVSTKTRDRSTAARTKVKLELRLLEQKPPGPNEAVTFLRAAELYEDYRDPSPGDRNRIAKLVGVVGDKLVSEITQADLVDAARRLYPHAAAATRNRAVIKPGAAILHYAANNHWCAWQRIQRFREPRPETRAAPVETARTILAALAAEEAGAADKQGRRRAAKKKLLILWLFCHWPRISDALRVHWQQIDLEHGSYEFYVSKGDLWRTKPIAWEVRRLLVEDPEKRGPLFPWRTRSGVYRWLRPLVRRLGVKFTPHMARHYGGKELNRRGAGLKTIMAALDQLDPQSAVRYQDADTEIVRGAMAATQEILGNRGGKSSKRRKNA